MFSEKYTVKIIVDNTLLFVKDYTTYQAILDDFPVFETTENVRTCTSTSQTSPSTGSKPVMDLDLFIYYSRFIL